MRNIQTFQVFPFIPEPLAFLETLVRNIWWCWQRDAVELFRRNRSTGPDRCAGNPIRFFTRLPRERLEELARDNGFLAHMERIREDFHNQVGPRPPLHR